MRTQDKGAQGELLVSADLLGKGWSVYRSLSAAAGFDLVIWDGGILLTVEVKSRPSGATTFRCTPGVDVLATVRQRRISYQIYKTGLPQSVWFKLKGGQL